MYRMTAQTQKSLRRTNPMLVRAGAQRSCVPRVTSVKLRDVCVLNVFGSSLLRHS